MPEIFNQADVNRAIAVLINFAIAKGGGSLDLNVWLDNGKQFKLRIDLISESGQQEKNIDPSRPFSLS